MWTSGYDFDEAVGNGTLFVFFCNAKRHFNEINFLGCRKLDIINNSEIMMGKGSTG